RVVIRSDAISVGPEGMDARDHGMPRGLHLGRGLLEGPNGVGNVMEAFAALGEPVSVNARAVHWLDQLVLRGAAVESEPESPLSRAAPVLAALALRTECPASPGSGREACVEPAGGLLPGAHGAGELGGGEHPGRRHTL